MSKKIVVSSPEEIPEFQSEVEEAEFWETHEISDELWDKLPPAPPLVEP